MIGKAELFRTSTGRARREQSFSAHRLPKTLPQPPKTLPQPPKTFAPTDENLAPTAQNLAPTAENPAVTGQNLAVTDGESRPLRQEGQFFLSDAVKLLREKLTKPLQPINAIDYRAEL
ncbi:MAG: hypothetical protein ACRERV_15785 [Methylococcales bacterium]